MLDSDEKKRREDAIKKAAQERAEIEARMEAERKRQREEQEAREKAERERQCEQFMFLRLYKQMVAQNKHVESLRETLFSHNNFNLVDVFRMFDANKDGVIDAQEIASGLEAFNIEISLDDLDLLVNELVDDDDDGTIDMREFTEALTPKSADFRGAGKGSMGHLNVETRKLFLQAHMESVADLFRAMVAAERQFQEAKEKLQLNGENIFAQIDSYNMGYISTVSLVNWVSDNCGFTITSSEQAGLQRRFDKRDKYRITRDAFVACVSPAPVADEEEEDQQ